MEKGKEAGKSHESPKSRASRLACELRRVDEAIDMLGRGLAAAVTQREAILRELNRTAEANGLDPNDYYEGGMDADITLPWGK